jgi:hypothetical protein
MYLSLEDVICDVASKLNKNKYTYLDDAIAQAGFQDGDFGSIPADFT